MCDPLIESSQRNFESSLEVFLFTKVIEAVDKGQPTKSIKDQVVDTVLKKLNDVSLPSYKEIVQNLNECLGNNAEINVLNSLKSQSLYYSNHAVIRSTFETAPRIVPKLDFIPIHLKPICVEYEQFFLTQLENAVRLRTEENGKLVLRTMQEIRATHSNEENKDVVSKELQQVLDRSKIKISSQVVEGSLKKVSKDRPGLTPSTFQDPDLQSRPKPVLPKTIEKQRIRELPAQSNDHSKPNSHPHDSRNRFGFQSLSHRADRRKDTMFASMGKRQPKQLGPVQSIALEEREDYNRPIRPRPKNNCLIN